MTETKAKYIEVEKLNVPFDFDKVFPGCFATLPVQRIFEIIQRYSARKNRKIILVKDLNYKNEYCKKEFKAFSTAKKEEYHWENAGGKRLPKKAIRIDFFSVKANYNINILNNENYLGYCILIPQYHKPNTFRAAQTLLKIIPNTGNYLICRNFSVDVTLKTQDNNLTKKKFIIKAFPFQEHDSYFLLCAHVALSVCRWHIKKDSGPINHSEFENFADDSFKESMFPKMPSLYRKRNRGLNGPQIIEVAKKFSNPLYYSVEAKPFVNNLTRLIYRYIRTGIPILLVFDTEKVMHCVIIIGYTENNDLGWEISRKYYFSNYLTLPPYLSPQSDHEIDWVSHFIVQDNNFGPYLLFPYHKIEWLIKQDNAWFLALFPKKEQ